MAEIGYDKNGMINVLAIANKSGNIIFKYGGTTSNFAPIPAEPAPDDAVPPGYKIPEEKGWSFRDAMFAWCQHYGINAETFGKFRDALVGAGIVDKIPGSQMTIDQFNALCTAIQQNFGDQLKVTA